MDIRSQKTRQTISDCFIELLKKNHVSKITVTEVCRIAGINRATFYKHYLDIPDLQERLEADILTDFRNFLSSRAFATNSRYRAMLVELLKYAQEFGAKFYVLCSSNAASNLTAKCFQMLGELAYPVLKDRMPEINEERAKMLYWYITSGSGHLLAVWLSCESSMSAEEVADMLMLISGAAVQAIAADEKGNA